MTSGFVNTTLEKLVHLEASQRDDLALQVFRYQYNYNNLYHAWCNLCCDNPQSIKAVRDIPFLPISFFKTHAVHTTDFKPQFTFESSGTGSQECSKHYIRDLEIYKRVSLEAFLKTYGDPKDYCILGLLPSYLEKGNSSLVYMVKYFMEASRHPANDFFLNDYVALQKTIFENEKAGQKIILFGVAYALLDFADEYPMNLQHTIIIETGGMKGRKKEITRAELHGVLSSRLGIDAIGSEYGMTELLSQFYAKSQGRFTCPPWANIYCRAEDDPKDLSVSRGAINIMDLANIYSCSFIATDDAGILYEDGSFEVTGRLDNADIRGCSLMM
ncbi:MAG: hypothetical protein ABIT96_05500, partial [Ferruginibacter sp.]